MGGSNSVQIPGGGSEGYHVLRVILILPLQRFIKKLGWPLILLIRCKKIHRAREPV